MNAQANWWYEQNGERKGPASEYEISSLIRDGRLGHGSFVWKEGLAGWERLENTELKDHVSGPPPLTGSHINNSIVWILALAPLIGYFLEWVVADVANSGNEHLAAIDMANVKFWFITLALNIALGYLDEARLRKGGIDTSKFRGITWLVPVYLYQRSRYLNQNLAYFIVWIVCFVLMLMAG